MSSTCMTSLSDVVATGGSSSEPAISAADPKPSVTRDRASVRKIWRGVWARLGCLVHRVKPCTIPRSLVLV